MSSPTPAPAEPTSAATVAAWLQLDPDDTTTAGKLGPVVAAVNTFVRRLHDPRPDGSWAPDHAQGATMLAAHLFRRRKTVEGVMTEFTPEGGAVYIMRNDPHVAMLLQLGAWAPPVVG